ncbi:MAG: SMC-Scp complex subunit ScpB [Clostridia bacterium]|nr:SMC-Scp complex subunit ScpB [Clostridia bacterium]
MSNDKNTPETQQALDTVEDIQRAVEAILFAAGYPVKYEKLSEVIGLPQRDLRNLIEAMSRQYGNRGIQLLLFPDACQLATKEVFAPYIREALGIKRGGNLSASSLEVLAVVAYNQPVTRAYVDAVRGVDSAYAVSSLLDKGLIEAVGRLDAPGRPMLYSTTEKFLRVFGLRSILDLPETEALNVASDQAGGVMIEPDRSQLTIDSTEEQCPVSPEDAIPTDESSREEEET